SICLTSRGSAVRARVLPQKAPTIFVRAFSILMHMHYTVYILYSASVNKYYVGFTGGLIEDRVRRHNSNHKGFTGRIGDWQLMYTEVYSEKAQAQGREKEIKAKKSRLYIETLIAQ
ncbi:MAG: GIY-YIG nuclease family protein, partial [Lacibacter sp.]